ncbi:hypothetical protein J5N97_009825 [Dioscorea zingiberensis]|uniref:Pentatricopeptide repeat-containing protein n=1 Tax=Dioscorea zingiberensis TaxID=325984 RepID=A0A9D5HLV2_9LILI|nr:hypothetical protein J5N97_009825 [Dioscorea zingiberensis]
MLNTDCLRIPNNNPVFLNQRIASTKYRIYNKIPNFVQASSSYYGGFSANRKIENKRPLKWGSYGGCIPSILVALETFQDLDDAFEPWKESLSSKERTIILKEQTDWRRALSIFDWFKIKGCYELNVIHYNVMLKILGRARKWDHVSSLWTEMQSKCITPTNSTYGTLIDAFSKGGLYKEALLWLAEMYKQGMELDEVTMGIVVQTYKKAGEFQKAEQFFKRWSSDRNDACPTRSSYGLYTYNTLIDTYGKAGQLKEASNVFSQMLREGIVPDIVTFNTMIHISGNHGQLEEVSSLMEVMKELCCDPDTRTYNILISLYAKHDDITIAAGYFSKMKEAGLIPDIVSYRTLLYAFSIRKMVGEAETLIFEMEEHGFKIDEYTQSALTRMYLEAGLLKQAWSWFEKFNSRMSSECFSANIDAFGEHGHLDLAEKAFFCCLNKRKLTILVCNVMIKAYGIGKNYDKACELFDTMEKYGVSPDKCSYNSLVQILSEAELPAKAASYVRKMQEVGLVSDCIPFSMVMTKFAKLGKLDQAEDLFEEMVTHGIKPDIVIYSILINAFAEIGNIDEALSYVDSLKHSGFALNSVVCNSLIKLYTKVGNLLEARETYELARSLDGGPDVYSSNCMIDLYCENSMVKEAEQIFNNLKHRGDANEFSYAMMLCLYKKIGQVDEAYQIADEMHDSGLVTETLSFNSLIKLYASDGRSREAIQFFQQMVDSGAQPDDSTFKLLGSILIKHGASKEAVNRLELVRKNDTQSGLLEWIKAIYAISCLDDGTSTLVIK